MPKIKTLEYETKHPVLHNQMNPTWRNPVWFQALKRALSPIAFHGITTGLATGIQLSLPLKGIFQGWQIGLDSRRILSLINYHFFSIKSGHGYVSMCIQLIRDFFLCFSFQHWLELSRNKSMRPLHVCHEIWEICLTLVTISFRHNGQVSSCKAQSMHRSLRRKT